MRTWKPPLWQKRLDEISSRPGLVLGAAETITMSVPAALTSYGHREVLCNPKLVLRPRRAMLSGTLLAYGVDEASVRTENLVVVASCVA